MYRAEVGMHVLLSPSWANLVQSCTLSKLVCDTCATRRVHLRGRQPELKIKVYSSSGWYEAHVRAGERGIICPMTRTRGVVTRSVLPWLSLAAPMQRLDPEATCEHLLDYLAYIYPSKA